MKFQKKFLKEKLIEDTSNIDLSIKDMRLWHQPNFRAVGDSFKTIQDPQHIKRESGFKMTLQVDKENTKLSKQIISDPLRRERRIKEPYVEGFEFLGKQIERVRDKTLDVVEKEFNVNTSLMNTPLAY